MEEEEEEEEDLRRALFVSGCLGLSPESLAFLADEDVESDLCRWGSFLRASWSVFLSVFPADELFSGVFFSLDSLRLPLPPAPSPPLDILLKISTFFLLFVSICPRTLSNSSSASLICLSSSAFTSLVDFFVEPSSWPLSGLCLEALLSFLCAVGEHLCLEDPPTLPHFSQALVMSGHLSLEWAVSEHRAHLAFFGGGAGSSSSSLSEEADERTTTSWLAEGFTGAEEGQEGVAASDGGCGRVLDDKEAAI